MLFLCRIVAGLFLVLMPFVLPVRSQPVAASFRNEVTALPFPSDAQNVAFTGWTERVKFTSHSSLKSLAAFYLDEMNKLGWQLDESTIEIEDDEITLTFEHNDAEVELEIEERSKGIEVTLNTEGLDFAGIDDPAKLAAAGIRVPRATLFMQREIKLPGQIKDLEYDEDGVSFKSSVGLQAAFDNLSAQVKSKGFRESRRPIVTGTRRYTEFVKGPVEVSVNVFSHAFGARAILDYESTQAEPRLPALPAVASLPFGSPGETHDMESGDLADTAPVQTPINVALNKGAARVVYGGRKYHFGHVACFQTKDRGDYATEVVFSEKPIPLNKMQTLVRNQDDFSFGDAFGDFAYPRNLIIQLGDYHNLSFSADGTGIGGDAIENATGELKIVDGRVVGTLKMPPKTILSRPFSFDVTLDAAIITPNTRFSTGREDPVAKSTDPVLADSPVPMPPGVEDLSRQGSNFRKEYSAVVALPLAEVATFYRQEMKAKSWTHASAGSSDESQLFSNDTREILVGLKRQADETAIHAVVREVALAKREGILPEPGKGRLVLANAHSVDVLFTIGKTDYPIKAGRGAKEFREALNYSIAPGNYDVVIKIPGKQPQHERVVLSVDSTWAIIALPTGGYLPMQLY